MISSVSGSTSWISQNYSAGTAAQRHKDMFKSLDTNGDGGIDLTELQAAAPADGKGKDAASLMKEIDTNGDNKIDEKENETFLNTMGQSRRPMGPPPGVAKEAKESASETANKVFDALDTNKDGTVSLDELIAASRETEDNADVQALLKKMDENGDKSISKEEFASFLQKLEKEASAVNEKINMYEAQTTGSAAVGGLVDASA